MGEAYSPDILRGLLVPFSWATIDTADTDLTERDPRPGVPEAAQASAMVLQASGEQSSGTRRVRVKSGGYPNRNDATQVWDKNDSEWRGWDPPSSISSLESIEFPGSASLEYRHPHSAALSTGTVLVASCATVGAGTNVRIHRRTIDGAWATQSIYTEAPDGTNEHHPVLVALPSGRVLCIFAVYDATSNLAQLRVYDSEDDGVTWAESQRYALAEAIDTSTYTIERIRAAYSEPLGQIALVLEVSRSTFQQALWQYASNDLGARFTLVDAQPGSYSTDLGEAGQNHDIVAVDSGFLCVYNSDGSSGPAQGVSRIVGNAYQSLWDAADLSGLISVLDHSLASTAAVEFALAADATGAIYLFSLGRPLAATDTPSGQAVVSTDGGETWRRIGRDTAGSTDGRWFWPAQPGTAHPQRFHACWHRGRVVLAHNADDAYTGTADPDALWCAYLGGYTTATLPSLDLFVEPTNALAWFWHWLPYELPTAVGATAVGTASSETLAGDLEISVTAGNVRYYRGALVTGMTVIKGLMAECEYSTDDATPIGIRIRTSDNTRDYRAEILTTHDSVKVYDVHAASQVGSTESISSGSRVTLRIAVANGYLWAGFWTGEGTDREWTAIANGVALTDNGAGAGVIYHVESGLITAAVKDNTFKWYSGRVTRADDVGALAEGFTSPDDLRGRPLSEEWTYIDDGLLIRAAGGPAVTGDTYSITTAHDYPIEHQDVLQYPSPAQAWQGDSWVSGPVTLAYDIADYDGLIGGPGVLGWVLMRCNVPEVEISYYDGSDISIATVDRTIGFAFARSGEFVTPDPSGSTVEGRYFARNELAGGWWCDGAGAMRKILSNTPGRLTSGATVAEPRTRIRLDGVDNTEADTGTGWVLPRDSVIIMHDATGGNPYNQLRITYDPNSTMPEPPEGRMVAGVSSPGEVLVWGIDPSDTRRRSLRPGNELTERRDGRRRSVSYAPVRETRSISWTEGVDTQYTHQDSGDDYVLSTDTVGAPPVAARRAVPHDLAGLIREINGSHRVVVDLPYIPTGTPDVVHLTMSPKGGAMLCRLTGDVPMETLLGDEMQDEVIRCSIVAEEEL